MSEPIHSEAIDGPRLFDIDGNELPVTLQNVLQVFSEGGRIESRIREWHEPIGDEM